MTYQGTTTKVLPRWLCRLLRRHTGTVGYTNELGPYWVCASCGQVLRERT